MLDPAAQYSASQPMYEQLSPIESNFWSRLFDLSFTSFVTPMIIRALYVLGLVIAFGMAVVAVIVALVDQGFWAMIWSLIFAPVWLLVVAVILRVWMEILIAIFRIAQASIEIAKNTGTRLQ